MQAGRRLSQGNIRYDHWNMYFEDEKYSD